MRPTLVPRRKANSTSNGSNAAIPQPPRYLRTTSSGASPVSKFSICYQAIFAGSQKPQPYPEDQERFYVDLFCLNVDKAYLQTLVDHVQDESLTSSGTIKSNIRELFFFCVKCLKDYEPGDIRHDHVVAVLRIILQSILSRALPNYSMSMINLLAGSLEQADQVFPDLVAAIDDILAHPECDVQLKERTLNLTLLIVTSINQGSITSYFLRRDLFTTLTKLISDISTAHLTAECSLLLGMLANYHKYETRNAILVRFEDLVDEVVMKHLRETASASMEQARDTYVQAQDDTPATFTSNVSALMSSLKLVSPFSPQSPEKNGTTREDGPLADLPPEILAMLLPIYDLCHSNKAFCSFLLHDRPGSTVKEPNFVSALISLSSYLGTHASLSARSRCYARLSYTIVVLLLEEGASLLASPEHSLSVRLCRQRQPTLPTESDALRLPICSLLDSSTLYLRFNLVRKRFDVETYLLVLRMVHKAMHHLKSHRIRLDYDWQPLLQSIMSLAKFLVTRQSELDYLPHMEDLTSQVLLTLDFLVVWADVLLKDTTAASQVFYEILRSQLTLTKLSAMTETAGGETPPPLSPRLSPSSPTFRRTSGSGYNTPMPKSPTLAAPPSFSSQFGIPEPSGTAAGSMRNLKVIQSHFGGKMDDYKDKHRAEYIDSDQVMSIIQESMDGLDLRESMALEDVAMRKYSENEHESFFKELVSVFAKDVIKLTQSSI